MSWLETRLKHLAEIPIVNGLGEAATLEDETWPRYIRTTDFAGPRELRASTLATLPPELAARAPVERGDLLMSAAGTVGKTYLHLSHEAACFAGYLVRFRPRPDVDPRFVAYWTETPLFVDQVEVGKVRSTIDNFSAGKYQNLRIRIPEQQQQRAIADFLDAETTRIDALIAKKRRQLMLGRERLAALLDLVGWRIGEREMRLNRLVRRFVDYRGATPKKANAGLPLVTAGHIKNGRVDLAVDPQFVSRETYMSWMSRGFPSIGDVLMTMEAPLGEVAQVEQLPIALAQRVILMKPDERFISADFLALALRTPGFQARLAAAGTGSTAVGVRADRLRALTVPVPTPGEQADAVGRVRRASESVRQLEERLDVQLRLLREHRQALITAAVTGQLRITGVAA